MGAHAPLARVVLADDHPVVLAGLRTLIDNTPDLALVGEARTGTAALRLIVETQPDVAIVDVSMPELNGLELTRRLAQSAPDVKIIILSFHEERSYVQRAFRDGARGYILKQSANDSVLQAIRSVLGGAIFVDGAIAGDVMHAFCAAPHPAGRRDLTERELEVLKLTARGWTNKEIAIRIDVGVKSVETFKARGAEKLALRTRADIVRHAIQEGWLGLETS